MVVLHVVVQYQSVLVESSLSKPSSSFAHTSSAWRWPPCLFKATSPHHHLWYSTFRSHPHLGCECRAHPWSLCLMAHLNHQPHQLHQAVPRFPLHLDLELAWPAISLRRISSQERYCTFRALHWLSRGYGRFQQTPFFCSTSLSCLDSTVSMSLMRVTLLFGTLAAKIGPCHATGTVGTLQVTTVVNCTVATSRVTALALLNPRDITCHGAAVAKSSLDGVTKVCGDELRGLGWGQA